MKKILSLFSLIFLSISSLVIANYWIKVNQENRSQAASTDLSIPLLSNSALLDDEQIPSIAANYDFTGGLQDKFVWIGKTREQFNSSELQQLAQYNIVVIAQSHGDWSARVSIDAAKAIAAINPNVKIFPYYSMSKVHKGKEPDFLEQGFRDEWYLRDLQGNKVVSMGTGGARGKPVGYWVDLSNPDYRKWAINTLARWLTRAPYAGVAFDEANPIEKRLEQDVLSAIGQTKVSAWDLGQKILLQMAKSRFPDKLIIENGELEFLQYADMKLNENFCFNRRKGVYWSPEILIDSVATEIQVAKDNKIILQKVNFSKPPDFSEYSLPEQHKAGRFCYALFLLGYSLNHTYFKFGNGYGISSQGSELERNALEMNVPLGQPVSSYHNQGNGVLQREFSNGYIYINVESKIRTIKAPKQITLINGGTPGKTYLEEETFTIPAQDAWFFVKQVPKPGDLNGDGKVDIFDYNVLVSKFGNPYTIFDYNILVANYGK